LQFPVGSQFTVSRNASPEFIKQHRELGQRLEPNVAKAAEQAFSLLSKLPTASRLKVAYEHQGSGKLIGEEEFEFDSDFFNGHCSSCEEFWLGKRAARPTGHSWKCGMCQYRAGCEGARIMRQTQLLTENRQDNGDGKVLSILFPKAGK